jgi:hypothetical protein
MLSQYFHAGLRKALETVIRITGTKAEIAPGTIRIGNKCADHTSKRSPGSVLMCKWLILIRLGHNEGTDLARDSRGKRRLIYTSSSDEDGDYMIPRLLAMLYSCRETSGVRRQVDREYWRGRNLDGGDRDLFHGTISRRYSFGETEMNLGKRHTYRYHTVIRNLPNVSLVLYRIIKFVSDGNDDDDDDGGGFW